MAACFHLRSVKGFSFLLVLLCFSYGFEFGIAPGQPSDGYSYECSIFHPPPPPRADYPRSFYFTICPYFKRRPIQQNFTISAPSHKASKHGLVTLALRCYLFWMDLNFCMEIRRNPGQTTYFFVLKIKIATTMENM